jgi:hypothetical protein
MWPSTRPRTCSYGFDPAGAPVAFTPISGNSAHPVALLPTARLPSPSFGFSVTRPPPFATHSVLRLGASTALPPAATYFPSAV